MKRFVGCVALIGLLLALCAAPWLHGQQKGEEPRGKEEPGKVERLLVVVQHASAKDLAAALSQHFKGEPAVQVVAEPNSNSLLLTGPTAVLQEIARMMPQLDQPLRTVSVDVLIAEVTTAKGDQPKEIDTKDLSGPTAAVMDKVQALKKAGQLGALKQFHLTTTENREARTLAREARPYVTGSVGRPNGTPSSIINYRDVGTVVTTTPRLSGDGGVNLDLQVEDARMVTPEDGAVVGTNEKGEPIRAPEFVTSNVSAKLSVPSGQAAVVSGVKTTSKSQTAQTLVIVAVRVEGEGGKGK